MAKEQVFYYHFKKNYVWLVLNLLMPGTASQLLPPASRLFLLVAVSGADWTFWRNAAVMGI